MTENNDPMVNQLHREISRASDAMVAATAEIKNLQGDNAILRAELAIARDEIRRLLEHHELLVGENNTLRRQLSDIRYQYRRDFNGDL